MDIISRQDAKNQGLKFYFTGQPCKRNHIDKRYVINTSCYQCHKLSMRRYYNNNIEHLKSYARQHYEGNKEYYIKWTQRNQEHLKNYRNKNKEYLTEQKRTYNEENREKLRYWNANRRAKKLQATPPWFEHKEVKELYQLQNELIKEGIDVQVDHIIPLNSDKVCGLHCKDNLIIIPKDLNLLKSNIFFPELGWGAVTLDTIENVILNKKK